MDDLKIKISKSSNNNQLILEVEDKNTIIDIEARSRGFKWFLSFYLKYRAYSDGDLVGTIFLMDEPGLFLHPKGQKDLINYLEQLSIHNQIIYTTHSPFMLNRLRPNRIRVIEKNKKEGTIVNHKGFSANWKPLRTSLGIVLSDSFYFADKTLLVEGDEDKLYILTLLRFFDRVEKLNLDLNLLSIIEAGGAYELPSLARILISEERPVIVLIDSDSKKALNNLQKLVNDNYLKEIKEVNNFFDTAITIQDLLPILIYEKAVQNFINKLLEDGTLKANEKNIKPFKISNEINKLDKVVEKYVKDNFSEESISKVGIARCFEEILETENEMNDEFQYSKKLINWIIKMLDLKIKH